jgi:hypothetical protein
MRLLFLLLMAAACGLAQTENPLRVLFLGNSYTYYNNLPDMVAALSQSTPGRRIEAKSVTRGGATLADLWRLTNGLEVLRGGTWDTVVLQDQSTLGQNYVDGRWGVNDPAGHVKWAKFWNTEIQRKEAKTLLYLTWARKAHPEFQTGLNYAYALSAGELGATISPAGLAWKRMRELHPTLELFDPDGSHPSPVGSYLTACVFLEVLGGRGCEGATRNLPNLKMSEAEQRWVIEAAHYGVEQYKAGILVALPKPDYGAAKVLPLPVLSKSSDWAGTWQGAAKVYNGTHHMDLQLEVDGRQCKGSISLHNSQTRFRASYALTACTVDADTLVFATSDPRFVVEDYKAVLSSEGHLVGTHTLRSTDAYARLFGSFDLKKVEAKKDATN